MFWCQQSEGVFTYCNVLNIHFLVMLLYTNDAEVEVHIYFLKTDAFTLFFSSFHILSIFIQKANSLKGRYMLLIIFFFSCLTLFNTKFRKLYHFGKFSLGDSWPQEGKLSVVASEPSWAKTTLPLVGVSPNLNRHFCRLCPFLYLTFYLQMTLPYFPSWRACAVHHCQA